MCSLFFLLLISFTQSFQFLLGEIKVEGLWKRQKNVKRNAIVDKTIAKKKGMRQKARDKKQRIQCRLG